MVLCGTVDCAGLVLGSAERRTIDTRTTTERRTIEMKTIAFPAMFEK